MKNAPQTPEGAQRMVTELQTGERCRLLFQNRANNYQFIIPVIGF